MVLLPRLKAVALGARLIHGYRVAAPLVEAISVPLATRFRLRGFKFLVRKGEDRSHRHPLVLPSLDKGIYGANGCKFDTSLAKSFTP